VAMRWVAPPTRGPFPPRDARPTAMVFNLLRAWFLKSGPATYLPGGTYGLRQRRRPELNRPDIQYLVPRRAPPDVHLWFPGLKSAVPRRLRHAPLSACTRKAGVSCACAPAEPDGADSHFSRISFAEPQRPPRACVKAAKAGHADGHRSEAARCLPAASN